MVGRLLWIPMCKSVGAFPDPRDNGSGDKKRILRIYISLNGSQPPFLFMKDRWSWTPPSNCGNTGNMPIQGHSTLYRKPQIKREDCPEKKEIMRGIEQRDLQKLILGPEHIYLTACSFLVPKSHPTLCNPHGLQPTRLLFPGIFQARILEWVVISFSWRSSWLRDWTHVSCISRWILYHWATREAQCVVYRLSKIASKDYKFTSSPLIRLFLPLRFSFFKIVLVNIYVSSAIHPMDCSPAGSSAHGIFLGRILE